MTEREAERYLESFRVIADTREQNTARARKRFKALGPVERATLSFGDYCGNIDLDGGPVYDTSDTITPRCCVERKMSLDELAMCFTRGRDRFRREFQRAEAAGAKVYLLIEGGSYEDIIAHRYRSKFASNAFLASLIAWCVRYNITPVFCRPETSAELIFQILYREMKEGLMQGEYG